MIYYLAPIAAGLLIINIVLICMIDKKYYGKYNGWLFVSNLLF